MSFGRDPLPTYELRVAGNAFAAEHEAGTLPRGRVRGKVNAAQPDLNGPRRALDSGTMPLFGDVFGAMT